MSNFKRGYRKTKMLNWGSPKILRKLNDRENLNIPKRRKKPCKATKGLHDFQLSKFVLQSHGRFRRRIYPRGYSFFHLRMDYKCACGKKGGRDKSVFIF